MAENDIRKKIKNIYKVLLRIRAVSWAVSIAMAVLVGRLFYLQVIKGDYYAGLAESNCVSPVKVRAPRGEIYDRNYKKLVGNSPSYTVGIVPYYFAKNEDKKGAIKEIADILDMKPPAIQKKLSRAGDYVLEPVIIKRDVSGEELSLIAERSIEISGLSTGQEPKRYYEEGSLAPHILGYVGEIAGRQLDTKKYEKYRQGDIIGQAGIENYYNDVLKGKDGAVYILTDAKGRQESIIKKIEPQKGKNIVLTIDYRLQKYAEQVMEAHGYKGAVIAIEPESGEILCMASKPDFDIKKFSGKIDIRYWKKIMRKRDYPMTNRAVQGLYSPGSIFKIPVALGALNEGVVGTEETILCEGIHWIKTWPYKCWTSHGWVNFKKSIRESCDIYFYLLGQEMKVELLRKYALMFGLGEKTGVDLPGEKDGVVPSREWKRRVMRTSWFPGNTVMLSIGQGFITSTPLQILNIMCAMANRGYAMTPRFLKAITLDDRTIYRQQESRKLFSVKAGDKDIKTLNSALRSVVSGYRGTGANAAVKGIKVAGKTGTVENPQGETHAMFAGFAPYDDPEITVFVLVEHGGGGGQVAAPIAGSIIEYYLKIMR